MTEVVNFRNDIGLTPLHVLCLDCDEDKTRLDRLLEMGADIDARTNKGRTAIQLAALTGKYNFVRRLIKAGADINAIDDALGYSVLHFAVEGSNGSLKPLVEAGADLEALDQDGETPLMVACKIGKVGAVERLCALGANTKVSSRDGEGTISAALNSGRAIAASNAAKMVRELVNHEADVGHVHTITGQTEIHYSAALIRNVLGSTKPYYTIFNKLIKQGENPWRKDYEGKTAISFMNDDDIFTVKSALKIYLKGREKEILTTISDLWELKVFFRCQSKISKEDVMKTASLTQVSDFELSKALEQ